MSELPPDPRRLRAILAHLDKQLSDNAAVAAYLDEQLADSKTVGTYLLLQRKAVQTALTQAEATSLGHPRRPIRPVGSEGAFRSGPGTAPSRVRGPGEADPHRA